MHNNTFYEQSFPLDSTSRNSALKSTFHAIDSSIKNAPVKVKIIGFGLPGVVQADGSLLAIPQIPVWESFNLEKELRAKYEADVYIENSVKLSAMGYLFNHLGEAYDNLVYLYVGNGIGSGIVLDRQLYQGSGNFSGEIGFMAESGIPIEKDFTTSGGCMEYLVNPFVDYSSGELKKGGNANSREMLIAILAATTVNHVALLNPDVVVMNGKIFDKSLIEAIRTRMAKYLPAKVLPRIVQDSCPTTTLDGLIRSCRARITTGTHLIKSNALGQLRKAAV
jgi:predicted NBD/HSP70 family sugar kinase